MYPSSDRYYIITLLSASRNIIVVLEFQQDNMYVTIGLGNFHESLLDKQFSNLWMYSIAKSLNHLGILLPSYHTSFPKRSHYETSIAQITS